MPVVSTKPTWKDIQIQEAAEREARIKANREARARGEVRQARPSTMEPLKSFEPRYDGRISTFENYCRMENNKLTPYSWITTGPRDR